MPGPSLHNLTCASCSCQCLIVGAVGSGGMAPMVDGESDDEGNRFGGQLYYPTYGGYNRGCQHPWNCPDTAPPRPPGGFDYKK